MKNQLDKQRRDPKLRIGDSVLINSKFFKDPGSVLPPGFKLRHLREGPYPILDMPSQNVVTVDLPETSRAHPTLNVDKVQKFHSNPAHFASREDYKPPPAVESLEGNEWEVEKIIGKRVIGSRLDYKVLWKGYPISDSTWEPSINLDGCKDLVIAFERSTSKKRNKRRGRRLL